MRLCSLDPGFILCWWPRSHAARHWPMRQLLQKGWRYYMVAPCCKLHWWNPVMKNRWTLESFRTCAKLGGLWKPLVWFDAQIGHLLIWLFPRERWLTFLWDVAGHLPTGKHLSLSLRSFWPERSLRLVEPIQGWPLGGDVRHSNFNLNCCLVRTMIRKSQKFNRVTLKTVDFWHFRFLISNSFPFLCLAWGDGTFCALLVASGALLRSGNQAT